MHRGIWQPPTADPSPIVEAVDDPTFHEFASEWFELHRLEWREKTISDYEWALSLHLLPFFADHLLGQITVEEINRYKATKLREGRLGATLSTRRSCGSRRSSTKRSSTGTSTVIRREAGSVY